MEIDSHADTHCFGSNFIPLYFTQQECTVSPFLSEYQEQENIQICTGATAYTKENGEVIILIFGQGLWFGNRMERSLINPYQCRAFGIGVCDDPVDPNGRKLGIETPDELIPLEMVGSTCGVQTRCPTTSELEQCRHIVLSHEEEWDPSRSQIFQVGTTTWQSNNDIHEENIFEKQNIPVGFNTESFISAIHKRRNITPRISATITDTRHHQITPELIAKKWGIGVDKARQTLKATTQHAIRSAALPLKRRYKTDIMSRKLRRLSSKFYTDTFFSKGASINGNTCAQLFTDGEGAIFIYPMKSKSKAGDQLIELTHDVGIPNELIMDGAREQTGANTTMMKEIRRLKIKWHTTEPHSPWQNKAENAIGIIKSKHHNRMVRRKVPKIFWDFGVIWEAEIYSRTAGLDGRTPLERITGDTIDISEWVDFEFYDICWYWDPSGGDEKRKIGRWLGVSHHVGSALCYFIVTEKGQVISRTSVQHFTKEDVEQPEIQQALRDFHLKLHTSIRDDATVMTQDIIFYRDDEPDNTTGDSANTNNTGQEENYFGLPDSINIDDVIDNSSPESALDTYDQYIGAEVCVGPIDGNNQKMMGKVTKRLTNGDTNNPGNYNPMLDHSLYEVAYPDGTSEKIMANIIAENMMSQIDSEGRHYQLLSEIQEHRTNGKAIKRSDGYIIGKNGNRHAKKTTAGWDLLVEWRDGSMDWVPLKDLRASNPVELAEYAIANNIADEPAFNWWAHDCIKRRDRMVSKVKAKYWRTSHKFGIRVPKSVDEAYQIDKETKTDYWTKAIAKEMKNVRVAFEKVDGVTTEQMKSGKAKPGYKYCGTHMIFDIKMDGKFTRKARLVADGHKTDAPSSITYSSVVSRDSVRIAFTLAALNDLEIMACDIGNAYLNAPCREKLWTIAGSEFGSEKGSVMIICRALYGLKSSGASWRSKFADSLRSMGYKPAESDPDVWLKRDQKENGEPYYKYILVYVDDVLHLHAKGRSDMERINEAYRLKDGSITPPARYLGANIDKVQLEDGTMAWSQTSKDYLTGAIQQVLSDLEKDDITLRMYGNGKRPYKVEYRPEIDQSEELGEKLINRYQQLIGILRWAIEIGRIDIMTEVSCLSQHLCNPRIGHLEAVYSIFNYIRNNLAKNPGRIVFDARRVHLDESTFDTAGSTKEQWEDFYPDAKEAIPTKLTEPLGKPVIIRTYVDANHAGNLANRRSHTGIIIYLNNAPILWYSKRQNTVETSSFGSEFIALRIATELNEALRYKLRTFGVPISGPSEILCDNKSVVTNSSVPTSVLNKRHNAICYHRVREAQAAGIIRVGWIEGNKNLADLFTKTTMATNVRHYLVDNIFNNKATVLELKDNGEIDYTKMEKSKKS